MKATIWLETSSPNTHKLFKSQESLKRWTGAASRGRTAAGTARPPRPAPPKRGFGAHSGGGRRAARTARSAAWDPSRARSPPPWAREPRDPGPDPAPRSRAPPRPARPALPSLVTYVTAEGNGSSDEGPISKDWKSVRVKASRQPAAIFAIEDRSRLAPRPGEGTVPEPAGGRAGRGSARAADATSRGWRAGGPARTRAGTEERTAARGRGGGGRTH